APLLTTCRFTPSCLPKNGAPKILDMRVPMILLRSMFAFVIVAVVLSMNARASHAYQTGDSQWCVVTNKGADSMQWECEYDTSDDCATAVAGTGGYCAINPFWQSDKSSHGR